MQKLIALYRDKDIGLLMLGCILKSLANACLQKSTDAKFFPFTETFTNLLRKTCDDIVGGPLKVFTRKAVVDESSNRKFANICKAIVETDASQRYLYLMCQALATGLHTRCDLHPDKSRFTNWQNKTRSFENKMMCYFRKTRTDSKIECF